MSKQYTYIERRIPATPRNKRLTDAIVAASSTGGGYIGGGGGASYWQLVTTDADGNALAEEDQYLVPVGNYSVVSTADVVAYSKGDHDIVLPIASASALGAVMIGEGLRVDDEGKVHATSTGGIGGIDFGGEGNVFSEATLSADGKKITFTRGITALTPDNYSNTLDSAYLQLSGGTISGVLYSTVTGKAPISVRSSVVCESLNADLLDGTHKGGLFTGLSNVNSEISITIGGTSKQLVVGYSSNCGNAATATQLKTFRTLWGQSFNGTKNVSGDMTNVGSLTASGLIKTTSDIVAYASSDAPSPFKYWYPSVDTTGKLTWKNDTSTTEPSPVNIKGPRGYSIKSVSVKSESKVSEGASVYNVYAESSTTNPIGTFTVYNGARGERGYKINKITQTASSSESGGTNTYNMYNEDGTLAGSFSVKNGKQGATGSMSASSYVDLPSGGTVFTAQNSYPYYKLGVKLSGGNGILGWNTEHNRIGNLYLNDGAPSGVAVKITNCTPIDGSDIRIKNVFYDVPNVLDKIEGISAFYYTLKEDKDKILKIGVSAQAVREVFPEAVTLITPDGYDAYYGVNYMQLLTAVGINGLKELYALVKSLQNRIEELESVISTLKKSDTL